MPEILTLDGVTKSFGAITVADNLSYALAQGEALGVIGPNGAGKTTMFNLITGTLPVDGRRVGFAGQDVTRVGAAQRCRAGMARSFQEPQPFGGLTVFENAMVAATQGADLHGAEAETHCLDVLDRTGLMAKANIPARKLTLLDRKRLEQTRALCAKPRLLLLDEIAGGLTEAECVSLVETIKAIHADGMSIIWIEHVVHALLEGYTADPLKLDAGAPEVASLNLGPIAVGYLPLLMFAMAVVVIAGLQWMFYRTALGRAFRAVSDNQDIAQLMGLNRRHIFGLAMALALAVTAVAVAVIFLGIRTSFDPASGGGRLIFGFEAVIIGGLGNLWGTLAGGVILGVAQNIGAQITPGWQVLAGHIAFLVILALRPRGLFPRIG